MASVGHIALGMAAARVYHHGRMPRWRSMASWSALSMLPDADVIGFALGVKYADPWGHRGAAHSFAFSIALGLVTGAAARRFKFPAVRTCLLATVVLASHGLLDTMTDGGLGCALLWPFDLTRYFAPWRPIPVAPIGLYFFSAYGLMVSLTELVLFSPLLVFALRSRRLGMKPMAAGLALWFVSVWLLASTDPIREGIVGLVLREDTAYAGGFSEDVFRTIGEGQPEQDVRRLLGAPFGEDRFYPQERSTPLEDQRPESQHGCWAVRFERGVVDTVRELHACKALGIEKGMSVAGVDQRLGPPPDACLQYSWSPGGQHHRARVVCISHGKVIVVVRRWN